MVTQEMIDRINTLYHKSQATGLTEEEKAEQAELRKKYVEAIRTSLTPSGNHYNPLQWHPSGRQPDTVRSLHICHGQ